jgi:hypothetical protein
MCQDDRGALADLGSIRQKFIVNRICRRFFPFILLEAPRSCTMRNAAGNDSLPVSSPRKTMQSTTPSGMSRSREHGGLVDLCLVPVDPLINDTCRTTGKTELYVGHNNFCRLEGKPTEINVTSVGFRGGQRKLLSYPKKRRVPCLSLSLTRLRSAPS